MVLGDAKYRTVTGQQILVWLFVKQTVAMIGQIEYGCPAGGKPYPQLPVVYYPQGRYLVSLGYQVLTQIAGVSEDPSARRVGDSFLMIGHP